MISRRSKLLEPHTLGYIACASHSTNGPFCPQLRPVVSRHVSEHRLCKMRGNKGATGFGFYAFAMCAVLSLAGGIMRPEGWLCEGISIVLLVASAVTSQYDLGEGKILSIARENVLVRFSLRAQAYKCIIFCVSMALMINSIPSVAASQAAAQQNPQQQNGSWAAVVGIAVAIVGVGVAIVSSSWLSRNRVPLDFEGQQALDPHEGEAILDIAQGFLNNQFRINTRTFEDHLPQMIAE